MLLIGVKKKKLNLMLLKTMLRFRMDKIGVLQFAILQKDPIPQNYNLTTTLSFKFDRESRHLACITKFDFLENENRLLMILEVQCEFAIHPDDWKEFEKDTDHLDIPRDVLELFAVHTVGTSRGILFSKTEGTPYALPQYILPPINVREILEPQPELIKDHNK